MKYFDFQADRSIYRWKYHELVEIRFSNSQLIFYYDGTPTVDLNFNCQDVTAFLAVCVALDNFWENPPLVEEEGEKLPFPGRLFLRHFLHDAHSMLNNPEFIEGDSDEAVFFSLALFNLIRIRMQRKDLHEEDVSTLYDLMNFCREKTIARYCIERDDFIEYVHLVCKWWIEIFTEIRLLDEEKGGERDPEIEIAKVLWNEQKSTNHPQHATLDTKLGLYEFWNPCDPKMKEKFRGMINDLTDWFLRRYALKDANKLINAQRDLDNPRTSKDNTSKKQWLWNIGRKILNIASNKLFWGVIILLSFVLGAFNKPLFVTTAKGLLSFLFLALTLSFVYSLYRFYRRREIYWFKKMIPRLSGGIIVGYLPLLMTGDMWKFCLNITWLEFSQIVIVSLLACRIYLYVEVNNVIKNKNEALKRSRAVLFLGCIESLIVGLVFCSLFGPILIDKVAFRGESIDFTQEHFLRHLPKEIHAPVLFGLLNVSVFKNLVHVVYPPVILLYFPLALFVGVFVQIFWEDKPITEPL